MFTTYNGLKHLGIHYTIIHATRYSCLKKRFQIIDANTNLIHPPNTALNPLNLQPGSTRYVLYLALSILKSAIYTQLPQLYTSTFQWTASLHNSEVMPRSSQHQTFPGILTQISFKMSSCTDLHVNGHGTLCAVITADSSYAGKFPGGVASSSGPADCVSY